MRHIDLDQFWPKPATRSGQERAETDVPRSGALATALTDVPAPPPLPQETAIESFQARPLEAHDGLAHLPEELLAASAGWIEPEPPAPVHSPAFEYVPATPPVLPAEDTLRPTFPEFGDEQTARVSGPHDVEASPATRKRRDFTPLIWGGGGFMAGMLAWHVVGFWSFVSNVVLNLEDPRAKTLEGLLPHVSGAPPEQKNLARLSSPAKALVLSKSNTSSGAQLACVALAMNRAAGDTSAVSCQGSVAELRDAGFNRRTDRLVQRPRLQDPVAWTDSTAVQVTTPADTPRESAAQAAQPNTSNIETGTLRDADLKLDLNSTDIDQTR